MTQVTTVFSLLDEEWARIEHSSEGADALRAWKVAEPRLEPLATLAELVAHVRSLRGYPAEADAVLVAIAKHAASDNLAVRTLLQLLLPGCKALARRYAWMGAPGDVAAAIVGAAYERIRTYPVTRRPARVAANVICDVRQRLLLDHSGRRYEIPVADVQHLVRDEDDEPVLSCSEELVRVLSWAVQHSDFPVEGARLIARTRIAEVPVIELSSAEGIAPQSLRQRRLRFEHRLRDGVRAALADEIAA